MAVALLATACGAAGADDEPVAPLRAPLSVQDGAGTIAIGDQVAGEGRYSVDGSTAVVAAVTDGHTTVRWLATEDGTAVATIEVPGELDLVAVDVSGSFAALVTAAGEAEGDDIAPARAESEIVVVDSAGEVFRQSYDGNLVPEAFANWFLPGSRAPGAAYVLEYTPAEHPTHYRVRTLDLATGALALPLNLRDKTQPVDQQMAGVSRTQLLAADDGLLFTLYRGHHDEGHGSYAFVHTLGLGNGVWCLLVPDEMDLAERAGALALDPAQEHLVLVSANGTAARIPIGAVLDVNRAPDFESPVELGARGRAPAVATGADAIWVGLGTTLLRVDPESLTVQSRTNVPVEIEAIAIGADGAPIVAGEGQVVSLAVDLSVRGTADVVAGLGPLQRVVTAPRNA